MEISSTFESFELQSFPCTFQHLPLLLTSASSYLIPELDSRYACVALCTNDDDT